MSAYERGYVRFTAGFSVSRRSYTAVAVNRKGGFFRVGVLLCDESSPSANHTISDLELNFRLSRIPNISKFTALDQ